MILILNTYMVKITMQERFSFVLLKSVHDLLHVLTRTLFCPSQPAPTAELDRTDDMVYHNVMEMVKVVVQLKNDVNTLPASEYVTVVKVGRLWTLYFLMNGVVFLCSVARYGLIWQAVGMTLRSLIRSVEDILPTLHESIRIEVKHRTTKAIVN